jgi:serine/threonine protein kinase
MDITDDLFNGINISPQDSIIQVTKEKLTRINQYVISDKKIGSGSFSKVYLGHNENTGEQVAIKKISIHKIKQQILEKIVLELTILKEIDHPNIVKCYDIHRTDTAWYIIMEFCDAGTLDNVIKSCQAISDPNLKEKTICYYLSQLKDALECIRKKKIIHRDLKPTNILLKSNPALNGVNGSTYELTLKLADFGFARKVTEEEGELIKTICGSPLYMAPELLNDQHYHIKADLWSFGVIMYQLLFGHHPMDTAFNISELRKKIKNKQINFHVHDHNKNFSYSLECIDLVSNLLEKNPIKRYDWQDLFFHQWFSDFIFDSTDDFDIPGDDISDDIMGRESTETIGDHQSHRYCMDNPSLRPPETSLDNLSDDDPLVDSQENEYIKINITPSTPSKAIPINKRKSSFTQSLYNYATGSFMNFNMKNLTSF